MTTKETPKSINIAVAEEIRELGSERIIKIVHDKLVHAEISKRADTLAAVIKLSEDTLREFRKASKPDQVAIDANGVKTETFSAKAFEAKKKLEEKLTKIDNIVVNALEKNEWGKLYELIKSGNSNTETNLDDTTENP
jgi:c-di-GMP-related signal transduction protein